MQRVKVATRPPRASPSVHKRAQEGQPPQPAAARATCITDRANETSKASAGGEALPAVRRCRHAVAPGGSSSSLELEGQNAVSHDAGGAHKGAMPTKARSADRRSVTRIGGSHRSSRTASSPSGPHPRLPLRTLPHILSHTMRVHITTRRLRATHMSVPVAPLVHCCMRCARVDAHPYPYARPARPPLRAGGAQLAPCKLRME